MSAPPRLRIALPLPLPQGFDYLPPPGAVVSAADIGRRVRVPFGPRELVGIVAEIVADAPPPGTELRAALALLDDAPLLAGELLDSLRWLARYTHAPPGEVFATALPAPLRHGEPLPDTHAWAWALTPAGTIAAERLRKGTRPRRLAELLREGARDEDSLDALLEDWRGAARTLAKRGLAERIAIPASRIAPEPQAGPALNDEQQAAVDAIHAARGFSAFLLDGVTGSGKTEVYLHAIADCLRRGRQALVLVPEIGLTPQTLARFRARLGVPVHALHSGLSDGERARTWAACLRGEARVVVGTRSAVFVPLPDAGLVVVDEEHDASYKQQDGIRYHARDFALVRAKALGIPVVLGSATPSLESLHNARNGRYAHLRLRRRAGEARAPAVRVVDVRKRPLEAGLSPETLRAIDSTLAAGGQVLVFKNRRGYAPVLLCHDCGWSAHCKRCDAPMTVHAGGRRLQCHHCGCRQPTPMACPDCGGLALQPQGVGSERLEEVLAEKFSGREITNETVRAERSKAQLCEVEAQASPSTPAPRAYAQSLPRTGSGGERKTYPVVRIDRSTTQRRDAMAKHLDTLGDAPGILVGTQILAKGHDLPHLTLVVVVGVDEGLFSADFRAGEKLAQQLIQVAGRAGRAEKPGEVWLQTHHPEHPLLNTLINGGYHAFAEGELAQREAAGFPPFAHLALLRAEAQHADAVQSFLQAAKTLFEPLSQRERGWSGGTAKPATPEPARTPPHPNPALRATFSRGEKEVELHGPMPAPMPRRAGFQRMQLLLSSPNRRTLHATLDYAVPQLYELPEARKVRWSLDVDPVDLY